MRENELKRKPFNAKINEMSMANATTFKNRKMNGESTVEFMLHKDSTGAAHMDSNLDLKDSTDLKILMIFTLKSIFYNKPITVSSNFESG